MNFFLSAFFRGSRKRFPYNQPMRGHCHSPACRNDEERGGGGGYRSSPAGVDPSEVGSDVDVVKADVPLIRAQVAEPPEEEEEMKNRPIKWVQQVTKRSRTE